MMASTRDLALHTIKVYFRRNPTFMDDGAVRVDLKDYMLAATVHTVGREQAYRLTNSIDDYWPENRGVTAEPPPRDVGGWRSCSVGDLLETPDGFFLVAMIGFRRVTVDE